MNKELIKAALRGNSIAEFSSENVGSKAVEDILAEFGLNVENVTTRDIIAHKAEMFAIIAEAIDEILPLTVTNILGQFAEVKQFGRGDEVVFEVRKGKRRAKLSIRKGARGGIYRAAQWDNKVMALDTEVWSVGIYVTLEDILLGRVSLAELYQNVLAGFEEKVWEETVAALRTAKTLAPASHIATVSGDLEQKLDEAIRIARAYGDNVCVFGFRSEVSKIQNIQDFAVREDRTDVREYGFVKIYKGTPVILLPNYILEDGDAITWAFKENDLFILTGDAKPVKIGFRGEAAMVPYTEPGGGEQWDVHKMVGLGLLLADNVCIVTDGTDTSGRY